ncbi:hypothetical protein SAMD00023353_10100200 [Rosellinia necatrix]|uniref:Uncharacterized protein n=1 Tax=Rosellinia necatrix TaxID=77044 RepID=A0A1S8AC94_ROSNE|nr:hypothetical protein SAMD00023353_10100200 [Rosellinia necatrix]
MSFGFSVSDFLQVIQLVNKVRKDFAGAPRELKQISDELRNLENTIRDIDVILDSGDLLPPQQERLRDITRTCRLTLEYAQELVNNFSTLTSRGGGVGKRAARVWNRLQWDSNEVRDLRDRIASSVTAFIAFDGVVTRDVVIKIKDGQKQQEERQKQQEEKQKQQEERREQQEILNWLTPIDYSTQQSDFISRRQQGTGQWLLSSPEYQHWVATKKETLFCPGIPGAGKTIMASIIVDDLLNRYSTDNSVGIGYIFFNFGRHDEQSIHHLMASLVKQLAQTRPLSRIQNPYQGLKEKNIQPSSDQVRHTLHSLISEYSRAFIVIDALDECQVQNDCRNKFISEILDLSSKSELNLLVTSRSIPEITIRFDGVTIKEISASNDDIIRYLDGNMSCLPDFVSRNSALRNEIKDSIIQCVNGMFLLAQLRLDSLRGKRSPKAIRMALSGSAKGNGPDAYDIAYGDAMARIEGQLPDRVDLARETLSWIIFAQRPLNTTELTTALGVELGTTEFDQDNLPDLDDIVSSCCGLVTLDEQSDIIRLVHYTTQEYFERNKSLLFPRAERYIAQKCVTYLSFDAIEPWTPNNSKSKGFMAQGADYKEYLATRRIAYPLYTYACLNWGSHAYLSEDYEFCWTFLTTLPKVRASAQQLYNYHGPREEIGVTNGLHLAAKFGLRSLIKKLAGIYNIDLVDGDGVAPIKHAICRGHGPVVEVLLEIGVTTSLNNELFLAV